MVSGFLPNPAGALAAHCVCVFCYGAIALALGPVAPPEDTPCHSRNQMTAFPPSVLNVPGPQG